jgi:hypothetical protein
MWRRVNLVWSDVSEECIASIFRVEKFVSEEPACESGRILQFAATCSRWFLAYEFFYPEDGGDTFLRNVGSQDLHGATSQKTAFFIVTAVKTSNLTILTLCFLLYLDLRNVIQLQIFRLEYSTYFSSSSCFLHIMSSNRAPIIFGTPFTFGATLPDRT